MSKTAVYTTSSLLAFALLGIWLTSLQNAPPPTAALSLPASSTDDSLVPLPQQKPVLEIGEKTKLFMNDNAYLFGGSASPKSAALSRESSYHIGFGREIENPSGNKLRGEVSFNLSDQVPGVERSETTQTRLTAAYLGQINKQTNFRAGLSTDLAPNETWSTLELQFSVELKDDLSLRLNHDSGRSFVSDTREHQTGLAIEKLF